MGTTRNNKITGGSLHLTVEPNSAVFIAATMLRAERLSPASLSLLSQTPTAVHQSAQHNPL